MDVSIVIVNYNTAKYLSECLISLIKYTKDIKYEIIVIDNKSQENDILTFPNIFPSVKFIFREINDGFGTGCNIGVKHAKGKYICLVNPDIKIKHNILLNFYNYLEKNNNIVACSGLQYDNDNNLINSFDNFPSISSEFRNTFYIGYKKYLRSLLNNQKIIKKEPFIVDYHIGAFLFLSKYNYLYVNGFDEDYFLYSEDIDIGYRLNKLGKKTICLPGELVQHFCLSSVRDNNGKYFRTYHILRSKLIYIHKHFSFIKRIVVKIILFFGFILRIIYLPFNKLHRFDKLLSFKIIIYQIKILFKYYNMEKILKMPVKPIYFDLNNNES